MTALAAIHSLDDNMGLGTPNFFSSAWNPESSDFTFTEAYQTNNANYSGYALQGLQGKVETKQLDYFSTALEHRLSNQSTFQFGLQSGASHDHDDLNRILEAPTAPIRGQDAFIVKPESLFETNIKGTEMQGVEVYNNSAGYSSAQNEDVLDPWQLSAKQSAVPPKLMTQLENDTGRRTSLRYGQITPVDSPPDGFLSPATKAAKSQSTKTKDNESSAAGEAPKVKKARKSKKKPLTKEQEDSKRKKFLERNRVAADKCRQNRKKWVDDLQAKAHSLGADNTAKKAQVEQLEQDIAQLKSLIFIHSRSCNEKDILVWVDQEANKVQTIKRAQPQKSVDKTMSPLDDEFGEVSSFGSRPTSSYGFGSVGDAVARRYSEAITQDGASPTSSGLSSSASSRRPSAAS